MAYVRVGVISDTHGLLRPEALEALAASNVILHAGDIGDPAILERLATIAPVHAVRGNNDRASFANALPELLELELEGARIAMVHDRKELPFEPSSARADVIVSGHSHAPHVERREGVLFLNPGSAGPRRFRLPISVAELCIVKGKVSARIVELFPR